MQRSGVFIGVDQTGTLPRLHDAAESAHRMHRWAIGQGMKDGSTAVLVTDENGPVTPDQLCEVVDRVIQQTSPEQLVVYFAGHGTILRRSEHWLLSKAPTNPTHAVDLAWSADAAINGQVPNVVFISDACRTAPEGIQAQNVQGGSIFTNDPMPQEHFVDTFFACALGRPAAEIKDEQEAVASYRAVYTDVLLDALDGRFPDVFQHAGDGDQAWYADLRRLRDTLSTQVPRRIREKKLTVRFGQVPQARITSDPGAWLARLDHLPGAPAAAAAAVPSPAPPGGSPPPGPPPHEASAGAPPDAEDNAPSDAEESDAELGAPTGDRLVAAEPWVDDAPRWVREVRAAEDPVLPLGELMTAAVRRTADMLRGRRTRDHFETRCGVTIAGAGIDDARAVAAGVAVIDGGSAVRAEPRSPGCSVLLRLDAGSPDPLVTLVPLLDGFLTSLTVDEGELLAVEYEPSANSPRWDEFAAQADTIRALRSEVASASAFGVFDPDDDEASELADRVRYGKSLDPALAVYAGYAYYEGRRTDAIGEMADLLRADLDVRFFDLELLARRLGDRVPAPDDRLLPGVPLLSQGWSLVRSHGARLPAELDGVDRLALDSLWSVYRPDAWDQFANALETGVLR